VVPERPAETARPEERRDAIGRRAALALADPATSDGLAELREALADPAPSIRQAAFTHLARHGQLRAHDALAALGDLDAHVRRRAAEELARHCRGNVSEAVAETLTLLLDDASPSVVEAAAFALGELGVHAAARALEATARTHPDPLCRESAVAALGALGDPASLPTVLGALDDRPAVRRRAAVALAAFDGPAAEAGLAKAAADRDWQTRAIAQALLGAGRDEGPPGA
jgi:HEAT repeat protein